MSNLYKIKSSATRAAKAALGADWATKADIVEVDGMYSIQMKGVEVAQQLADIEADAAKKVAKAKELKAKKPVHIPANPISEIVAAPVAPIPTPVLPAFLQTPPPAPAPVALGNNFSDLAHLPTETVTEFDAESAEALAQADEMEAGDVASLMAAADRQADAQVANSDSARPRMSTTPLPTKKVWTIADSMPDKKRKEVIEECVRQGIAYGTARTQYQHWFKCVADQKVAPLAVIGADGSITMTNGGNK